MDGAWKHDTFAKSVENKFGSHNNVITVSVSDASLCISCQNTNVSTVSVTRNKGPGTACSTGAWGMFYRGLGHVLQGPGACSTGAWGMFYRGLGHVLQGPGACSTGGSKGRALYLWG